MKRFNQFLLPIVLTVGFFPSCSSTEEKTQKTTSAVEETVENNNIGGGQASVAAVEGEDANALQVAKSLEDFSTLVAAIEAAGVEDAVVNTGPLTIFAPLNSAFDKLLMLHQQIIPLNN